MPSMRVSSCETTRRSTSPLVLSRFGAIESISSMKMMAGELCWRQRASEPVRVRHTHFFSASSKALRRLDSDSPAILLMI